MKDAAGSTPCTLSQGGGASTHGNNALRQFVPHPHTCRWLHNSRFMAYIVTPFGAGIKVNLNSTLLPDTKKANTGQRGGSERKTWFRRDRFSVKINVISAGGWVEWRKTEHQGLLLADFPWDVIPIYSFLLQEHV